MLTVKTFIAKSKIHNIGLFAAEDIKKGSLVWELVPKFDLEINKDELPPPSS